MIADAIERSARGITRYLSRRKDDQTVLRTNPVVWPMLESMENQANALLHFCLGFVSITSRLRGVVTAVVTKENRAYSKVT